MSKERIRELEKGPVETPYSAELAFVKTGEGRMAIPSPLGRSVGSLSFEPRIKRIKRIMEQVNHPKHYNNHPQGLECIDIIRHYTFNIGCAIKYLWRAGLKESFWRSNNDKAVEDLQKALWYINDYKVNQAKRTDGRYTGEFHMAGLIRHETLCSLRVISDGFNPTVAKALRNLLRVGLLSDNCVWRQHNWEDLLDKAAVSIQIRIEEIKEG